MCVIPEGSSTLIRLGLAPLVEKVVECGAGSRRKRSANGFAVLVRHSDKPLRLT